MQSVTPISRRLLHRRKRRCSHVDGLRGLQPELEAHLAEAAALLRRGELVAFPTETVYGLAGNALSPAALQGIYRAKGRPSDNPLIVHIHSHSQFLALGRDIPLLALRLAERFWPGPLTLIIPTAVDESAACATARAGLDCVGVRIRLVRLAMNLHDLDSLFEVSVVVQ
jgi:L-threonylcarbamoyladenylate synthase